MDENIGKIYGDIQIIKYLDNKGNARNYLCKCLVCGREKRTQVKHLKNGLGIKHQNCGLGMKRQDMRFYEIWCDMRKHTTNPKCSSWKNYGGRGINSDDYANFIDFYDDLYENYCEHKEIYGEKNTTIDRINPNGNYEKGNIRWATIKEQNNNTRAQLRKFIGISPEGEKYIFSNIKNFSEEHNLRKENVSGVIRGKSKTHLGWHFYQEA